MVNAQCTLRILDLLMVILQWTGVSLADGSIYDNSNNKGRDNDPYGKQVFLWTNNNPDPIPL